MKYDRGSFSIAEESQIGLPGMCYSYGQKPWCIYIYIHVKFQVGELVYISHILAILASDIFQALKAPSSSAVGDGSSHGGYRMGITVMIL